MIPRTPEKLKEYIRERIGHEHYQTFMGDLSGSIMTLRELSGKYFVSISTLRHWMDVLGYRAGVTRMGIRNHYKVMERVKVRKEATQKLMAFLVKNH